MEGRGSVNDTTARISTDAVRSPPPARFRFSESKMYGYAGVFGILTSTVISLLWACGSNHWLQITWIRHYQIRYWEVSVPVPNYAVVMGIVVGIGLYIAHSFMAAPPPPTLKSMFDECSEELLGFIPSKDDYRLFEDLPDTEF